ncbi:MAG: PQQ-dependent sugar dehydrogenase [Gammaproteobacteria bacterium]
MTNDRNNHSVLGEAGARGSLDRGTAVFRPYLVLGLLVAFFCGPIVPAHAAPPPLVLAEQTLSIGSYRFDVRAPEGTVLEVLVPDLAGPRLLTFASNGDLFIGARDRVYRLTPPYREATTLVALNDYPHSVAFRDAEILIARTGGLYRAPYEPGQQRISSNDLSLLARVPGGRGHNSRTVRVGPDGKVYLSLGIAGNCSDQYLDPTYAFDDRRGGLSVLVEEGGAARWEAYATGLRNPVGYDWNPADGEIYASNNGPDHLGFEQPPEYFSRLRRGSFHGLPWFYFDGTQMKRDACIGVDPPRAIEEATQPVATFPARNAPMGVAFVPPGSLGLQLGGDAVVALRGSWATPPDGGPGGDPAGRREPGLAAVRFENGEAVRVDDLLRGFQFADGRRWLRPVGVAFGPDGALYITSDQGLSGLLRLRISN